MRQHKISLTYRLGRRSAHVQNNAKNPVSLLSKQLLCNLPQCCFLRFFSLENKKQGDSLSALPFSPCAAHFHLSQDRREDREKLKKKSN